MNTTARLTLAALVLDPTTGLTPEGRANATANSLCQMGEIGGDLPLTLADCAAGFGRLATAKGEDEPGPVKGRRGTCGELAKLAGDTTDGSPANLAAIFRAVERYFAASSDPRQAAMAATAKREADEIETVA